MSQYTLSKEVVDVVTNYLARRPYLEVADILGRLSQEIAPQLKPQTPAIINVESKNESAEESAKSA